MPVKIVTDPRSDLNCADLVQNWIVKPCPIRSQIHCRGIFLIPDLSANQSTSELNPRAQSNSILRFSAQIQIWNHIQIRFSGEIRIRGQIGARIRVPYVHKSIAWAQFPIRICSQIRVNLNGNLGVKSIGE